LHSVSTSATIARYTIEEAYEVADAIARNDLDELQDELGDLLLQVVCSCGPKWRLQQGKNHG